MKRKIHYTHEYMGVTIWRKTTFGPQLRWTAVAKVGDTLAADTLAGMRQLIREINLTDEHRAYRRRMEAKRA